MVMLLEEKKKMHSEVNGCVLHLFHLLLFSEMETFSEEKKRI